jgi:hypothetical protein
MHGEARDEEWHKFVGGNTSMFIVATDAKAVMQLAQAAFEAGWAARKRVDYEAVVGFTKYRRNKERGEKINGIR